MLPFLSLLGGLNMAAAAAAARDTDAYNRHFAGTNFRWLDQQNCRDGRVVLKFYYEGDDIPQAVALLDALFEKFRELVPTFSTDSSELVVSLRANRYLTINGQAVVLAAQKNSPAGVALEYVDRFFSQTLLRQPVRCPEGHNLELEAARYWVARQGDVCPAGRHPIGPLEVDGEIQRLIDTYSKGSLKKRLVPPAKWIKDQGQASGMQMVGVPAGKALVKVAGKEITFRTALVLGSKESAKLASKYAGKYAIPGVGLAIGAGCAVQRLKKHEYFSAIGEVISGLVTLIPGFGIALSVGVDVILLVTDLTDPASGLKNLDFSQLQNSYKVLGLDENSAPMQKEVDQAYRKTVRAIHSDKVADPEDETSREHRDQMLVFFSAVKENIYNQRGWA